ncbi:MAG: SGNH/GDSL hydrolase family protein [Ruminococcaceae bacterium]|nr:SGNH/GDSL hydrolase family protein [Oscillospiraceae bacterium]
MILSYSQIKEITLGALDVVQGENGSITFKRFTDEQAEYYRTHNEGYFLRSKSNSGIRLAFVTDASSLSIDYEILRGSSANWFQLDIVCDGAIIKHLDVRVPEDHCEGTFECALPEGEHTINVHLPNLAIFVLKKFYLAGANVFTPYTPKGPKILFLGDSITYGASSFYPSLCYTARLTAMTDATTLNQGIGGEIFRADILDPKLPFEPDIITIAFGTNDWSCARNNPELRISRADAYWKKLKSIFPNAKIVYISPLWRGLSEEENLTFLPARKEFEALARSLGITVVDGFTLVPHLSEFYQDKTLHPNESGFSLYAENLAVAFKKSGILH